ncbi:ATP-binding protein [Aquabacterium sp.]|uniref:ATP-binding protein n=1 Tax=Aquabacterium sp. TaxID=1872578 RepID=UPI002D0D3D43|nr:ATP-binding protein [Aquabacterium sp.]HSW08700.1 ATP-binding protein [Aquabacterium sp.]
MNESLIIAIVGAESTGKTQLARSACERLAQATGLRCTWVPELLRDWCAQRGRTPLQHEQVGIAAEQARRIDAAALQHELVLCDTTPLMTSVYSEMVFGDTSLYPAALAWQQRCALTLLTALDLPWVADGLQRDGPHVREPVDALLRQHLIGQGLRWSLVAGLGEARVEAAIDAIAPLLRQRAMPRDGLFTRLAARDAAQPAWLWACEQCDSPECEHATQRLARAAAQGLE